MGQLKIKLKKEYSILEAIGNVGLDIEKIRDYEGHRERFESPVKKDESNWLTHSFHSFTQKKIFFITYFRKIQLY